jgi:hypothetical protein
MSHYSDAYEYEAEKAAKTKKQEVEHIADKVAKLRRELEIYNFVPQRFKDSLLDLENYLEYRLS